MEQIPGERRAHRRYPIELPLRYRVAMKDQVTMSGRGVTRDISSGGVAFACDTDLPVGSPIEIRVTWPVGSREMSDLELRMAGRVVRSARPHTAVQLQRHSFEAIPKNTQETDATGFSEGSGGPNAVNRSVVSPP
jgi:hypothetical protein